MRISCTKTSLSGLESDLRSSVRGSHIRVTLFYGWSKPKNGAVQRCFLTAKSLVDTTYGVTAGQGANQEEWFS